MTHLFINQLSDRQPIENVYLAADKQLRTNRNGNLYMQVRLSDKTGSVVGMMWNADNEVYSRFENGDYVNVKGTAQVYNDAMQVIIHKLESVDADEVDPSDFITLGAADVERLKTRLRELLHGVKNYHLRNLADCFLMDEPLMQKFAAAPAGIKNHHAYQGGLLEHVVNLMELTTVVAPRYPQLDADVLLMGAFLHDIGKTSELTYDRDLAYSDEGQLIGHVVMGVEILNEKARQTQEFVEDKFPDELLLQLKHIIVSHHGHYEFGSPRLPMTREAMALHFLDNLDAKLHTIEQLVSEDANTESNWTTYQPSLSRKFYKGAS